MSTRTGTTALTLTTLVALVGVTLVPTTAASARPHHEPEKTNVILVIGDGMGYNSVDAASLYQYGTSLYQSQRHNPYVAGDGGTPRASQVYHPLTGRRHHMPEAEYADDTDVDEDDPDQPPHYHTHQLVPLYARGPLADDLAAVATGSDPVRGDYLLNTDIGEVIREHLGG